MTSSDSLSAAIRSRIEQLAAAPDECDEAFSADTPPLSEAEIQRLEAQFQCSIPAPVRELYTTVANGGFGPSYGLVPLATVKAHYDELRAPDVNDPHWRWPEALLPLINLGCAMYFCVDCSTSDGNVVWFEPNPHVTGEPWTDSFVPGPSFERLMRDWAGGMTTLELMESAFGLQS